MAWELGSGHTGNTSELMLDAERIRYVFTWGHCYVFVVGPLRCFFRGAIAMRGDFYFVWFLA
jgi:hypothetical protein